MEERRYLSNICGLHYFFKILIEHMNEPEENLPCSVPDYRNMERAAPVQATNPVPCL